MALVSDINIWVMSISILPNDLLMELLTEDILPFRQDAWKDSCDQRMLEYNVSSVRDLEVSRMKRREGQIGSIMFTGRLEKVPN